MTISFTFGGQAAHDIHIQYAGRRKHRRAHWECSCGRSGPEVSEAEAEFGAQMHFEEVQQKG